MAGDTNTLTRAHEGAKLLLESHPAFTINQVTKWLLPFSFPGRTQIDNRPHEAIARAFNELPGDVRPDVKIALANSLAGIINSEPEKKDLREHPYPERLLPELYSMAQIICAPKILAAPLQSAIARGMPSGMRNFYGPLEPALLDAASANQPDEVLAPFWLTLLDHNAGGDALRQKWKTHWFTGWMGLCQMNRSENGLFSPAPTNTFISDALLNVVRWIQKEVESVPEITAENRAPETAKRLNGAVDAMTEFHPSLSPDLQHRAAKVLAVLAR